MLVKYKHAHGLLVAVIQEGGVCYPPVSARRRSVQVALRRLLMRL